MLNQSKEVFCICVSFQDSLDSVKEEPETNVYLHAFYHIGGAFKVV